MKQKFILPLVIAAFLALPFSMCVAEESASAPVAVAGNAQVLAEELLELMDIQKNLDRTFEMIKQMQLSQIRQLGGESGASMEKRELFMDQMMQLLSSELSWEKMKADYIAIYTALFSEEELVGIIAFYKTEIGKKFLLQQPELMAKSMELSQKQMMGIMPKIQDLTRQFTEDLRSQAPVAAPVPLPSK